MDKQAIKSLLNRDLAGVLKASPPPYTYSDLQSAIHLVRIATDNAKKSQTPDEITLSLTLLHQRFTKLKSNVDKRERVDIDVEMYLIMESFCFRHKEFLN